MINLLENKIAVVTGSGQGIGEAIARELAEFGAAVIVTDINVEKGQAVADDLVSQGYRAAFHKFNVADFENIKKEFLPKYQNKLKLIYKITILFNKKS